MVQSSSVLEIQREFFKSYKTKDLDWRIEKLKLLKQNIKKYENEILEALKKDLNKSFFEGYATEVGLVYEEINLAIKNLKKWAKPKRKKTGIAYFPAKSFIIKEPYGCVLIIGPFNYPFQLCMAPLVGAVAAGNCAVIKSSEYTKNTGAIMDKIITETFEKEHVAMVCYSEGRKIVKELINMRFDYIFFTGSVGVGKIVMEAAAKNLIPVTLELGGKSPCIVNKDSKVALAAKRIVWGKFLNAGQTCVAPDYIFVHEEIKESFITELKKEIIKAFGEDAEKCEHYPKIINKRAYDRLISLIDKEKIYYGGKYNEDKLYIEPTILDNVNFSDVVMEDEIFGPIIPVLTFSDLKEVVKTVNDREKPLALYYFSEDKNSIDYVLNNTSSGGVTINDTVVHVASSYIPFGGVGNSGIGSYHGEDSYNTFSHNKSVVKRGTWLDVKLRYAPYTENLNFIKKIMK